MQQNKIVSGITVKIGGTFIAGTHAEFLSQALQKEYNGKLVVYKIDVDKERELAKFFGVKAMPTLYFIPTEGKATYAQGYMTQDQLKTIVDQYFFNNNNK